MSSSKLAVGIVGLPNVGKSTLFNALLKKQAAYAANFPFATIEPNVGIVPVPDSRLNKLQEVVGGNPPIVPATIEFTDIAGLIAGAHKGEGLGNKFLHHIRETDVILHVVRAFSDPDIVKEGSVDPVSDFEVIETELMMADLQTIENQATRLKDPKTDPKFKSAVNKLLENLPKGIPARKIDFDDEEQKQVRQLSLLSIKPILVALNISENDLKNAEKLENEYSNMLQLNKEKVTAISAKLEEQLADLDDDERLVYLNEVGIDTSGLGRVIKKAFVSLGLITFLTAGEKEVRAWTIERGTSAQQAAGVIHTDFEKNFIKADVVNFEDFIKVCGWKNAREQGFVRQEGRDYVIQDGDVVEFKVGV